MQASNVFTCKDRDQAYTRYMYKKWTLENEQDLIKLYPITEEWDLLLKAFPFSTQRGIQGKACQLGISKPSLSNKTTSCNENIFSTWNRNSAYLLGYLEADGTFIQDTRSIRVKFCTSLKDKAYLEELKTLVEFSGTTTISAHQLGKKKYKTLSFTISSRQWKKDLEGRYRIGKIPNCITEELLPHYIRGYFDGDGSIYKQGKYTYTSYVFGDYNLALDIHKYLDQVLKLTSGSKIYQKSNSKCCWYIRIAKQKLVSSLGNWMYKDASIYLSTKKI